MLNVEVVFIFATKSRVNIPLCFSEILLTGLATLTYFESNVFTYFTFLSVFVTFLEKYKAIQK